MKLVMGIANYAYDWPDKTGRAAHETAASRNFRGSNRNATSESEAKVEYDPTSLNPHYSSVRLSTTTSTRRGCSTA